MTQKTEQHPKKNLLFTLRCDGNLSPWVPSGQPSLRTIPKPPRGYQSWQAGSFDQVPPSFSNRNWDCRANVMLLFTTILKTPSFLLLLPVMPWVCQWCWCHIYLYIYGILLSGYIYLYLGISVFIIDTYFKSHGLSGNCANLFTYLWILTKTGIFKHLQK